MSERLRLLYVCSLGDSGESLPEALRAAADVTTINNPLRAIAAVAREQYDGVYIAGEASAISPLRFPHRL